MIWERKSCRSWPRVNLTTFAVFGRGPCLLLCQDTSRIWNACGRSARNGLAVHSPGTVTYCGKYIQWDLGKHIAFYHIELAQLWRCPVMWCKVWKGTAQDCIDHMRRVHKVPLSVRAANLARFFPPWTVTREQWTDMMMPSISGVVIDTLLFSRIGSPLCHRYRVISQTGSHAAFRGTYLHRLRVFLEESDSAVVRRLHRQLAQELQHYFMYMYVGDYTFPLDHSVLV